MKLNQTPLLKITGFLHALALFWVFYPPAAAALSMDGPQGAAFCFTGILLLIPVVLSFYGIRKIKRLIPYLLFGMLVSLFTGISGGYAAYFLCSVLKSPGSGETPAVLYAGGILAGILSLLLFLIRSYIRIKKGQLQKALKEMPVSETGRLILEESEVSVFLEVPHPLHWIFFAIHYVIGALVKSSLYWHMAFYLFLADVFICFTWQFTERFYRFLREHERTANLPVPTMKKVVKIIFGMAFLILLLFVLPSLLYGKEPLSALTPIEYELPADIPEMETPAPKGMNPAMEELLSMEEAVEPPIWLQHFFTLLFYLLSLIVCGALLVMIYRACKKAGEFFAAESEDEIRFLEKSFSDRNLSLKKKKSVSASDLSVNLRIRKYYKKTLRKTLKSSPKGTETPSELETAAGLSADESRRILHAGYEKARYSECGCTEEEWRRLRK